MYGQDVAQQQYLGLVSYARQHRRRQVGCRVHARWRAVVLVEHNAVESQLVGVYAFIEVALEKVVGRGRIEPRIGKRQA